MWKTLNLAKCKVLSQHLHGGTGETMKHLSLWVEA